MSIWPLSAFPSGIYRVGNPQSTLHLAAVLHVSISSRIGTRSGAEAGKSPAVWPYGIEAPVKSFGARTKLVAVLLTLFTTLGGSLEASNLATQSATGRVANATVGAFGAVPAGTTAVKSKTVLASNVTRLSSAFALRGAAIPGRINLAPSSLSFGNVVLGQTQTKSATLSNSGKTPVTLTRASVSGRGFAISGIRLPLILQAGQSVPVSVTFAPVAGGAASGSISVAGRTFLRGPRQPITFGRGGESRSQLLA